MKHGKKYIESAKSFDNQKLYDPEEGISVVLSTAKAKFDETIEAHIRLGVDSRHADQQVRGAIVLPNGTGKTARVLVFAKGDKADAAREAGADYVVLESAILFEAGLEGYVDRTIAVTAPINVRIARTCLRDGASAEEVRRRIAVQLDEEELRRRADYTLVNINLGELEYEVARLDKLLRDENRKHSA